MAVAGALIGKAIGAFGKKPEIPIWQSINASQVQKDTATGNLASFGEASKLAGKTNTFNQDELMRLMDKSLPGGAGKVQGLINSQLAGEIPQDVSDAIRRSGAQSGIAGGFGGSSGFGRNLTARDLGLTSLGITQQGLDSATRWLSATTAPQMDVSAMFLRPQERLAFEVQQQGARFNRDLMKAQVDAMPRPEDAALGREIDRFFNTFAQVGTSSIGGGGGGGGGGF